MKSPFCGATYSGRGITVDGQECVNLYPDISSSADAKAPLPMIGCPGLRLRAVLGTGSNRNMFVSAQERAFGVIGNKLVEILTDLTTVSRGTLATNDGRVSFAEVITPSASMIMIVDGQAGYLLDTGTNVFSTITYVGYQPGTSVVSMNGFFIQNTNTSYFGGSRFIYSGQYADANKWDALNYFTAETSPDPILKIEVINSELWLIGTKTIEIWYFTGDLTQLWAKVSTGLIQIGAAGRNAVATINNQIFWLGSNLQGSGAVFSASGYAPKKISTSAIDFIIAGLGDVSDCIMFSYLQEGHYFLILNFLSGNRTLCYDLTTDMWHERSSWDLNNGRHNHHRAISLINWQGLVYVGDYANANFYQWDLDYYTDNGAMIARERTAPHIHGDRKRLFFRQFEIDLERGEGLLPAVGTLPGAPITGPSAVYGQDPQAMLSWSDDGGFTWSGGRWASAGTHGNRLVRVRWSKLGMARDRVFRARFTDPIKWIIVDARCDIDIATR